ncbi:MAG: cupredoxin domain-containing protein [Actinomycetota bacterium]
MNEDVRNRVVTPILLPIGVVGGIALFAFSLSRVMLAIPKIAATIVALLIAAYVLGVAAVIGRKPEVPGRALGVAVGVGLAAVVGAGAVAMAMGPREITPPTPPGQEAEAADAEEGEEGEEGEDDVEIPDDAIEFVAIDNFYTEEPDTVPAGEVTFAIINEGLVVHNVVIEELGDELIVEADGGEVDVGEVTLEAGETYTYYCSIPGHRETMEGTFEVEG